MRILHLNAVTGSASGGGPPVRVIGTVTKCPVKPIRTVSYIVLHTVVLNTVRFDFSLGRESEIRVAQRINGP